MPGTTQVATAAPRTTAAFGAPTFGTAALAAKGMKFILLPAMFIDKPNYMRFEALAQDAPYTYEARGERESQSDGSANFAPSACRYVYRLPK